MRSKRRSFHAGRVVMGTKSNMADLASHFPPSSYLGRAANTLSGERKNGQPSYFDGVVVFPHENEILAHWRPRLVRQQRVGWDKTKYSTQCEVLGFAQIKGTLRAQVAEPVFLETLRDSNSVFDSVFRLFRNEHPSFAFTSDPAKRSGLSIQTLTTHLFVPQRLCHENVVASAVIPPSLLSPYATIVLDYDESQKIQRALLQYSHESSFSLLNGELCLHGRIWNSAKSTGCSFGRLGGIQVLNALTMFEELFEVGEIAVADETLKLTSKERSAQRKATKIAASTGKLRRLSLSRRELALENFELLQKSPENAVYAGVSSRRLRRFVDDSVQFYVPSQDEADWFPSTVLSSVLVTRGLTTIHLRPRMIEVVKETPFAIYRYFICGKGIWEWYQQHQPARYFCGNFEGTKTTGGGDIADAPSSDTNVNSW